MKFIPINKPILGEEERRAVLDVLDSGVLTDSSYEGGKYVREFEAKLRAILGVRNVIAVNSGTAALHCSLLALGIGKNDEVIVPSFTFLATANVVLAVGARPVFVDIDEDYNISPTAFKKAITKRTKAVIPVHLYGYPADMDEIKEIAEKRSIAIIEDAAQSLGALYKGRQTGTISNVGCFSMYATKVVTSGEGGAVATDDDEIAERVRLIRNHGMLHGYDSRLLGFNMRMPELLAAIGSKQLDKLDRFIDARRKNASFYNEIIADIDGLYFKQRKEDRKHIFYLYTLYASKKRDEIVKRLNEKGIGASVYFKLPVHKAPLYKMLGYDTKLPVTEFASRHVFSIPVHPGLKDEDLEYIAGELRAIAGELLK